MPGLSVKLPLAISDEDGFMLNKDYRALVKQNLKMIILTSPGERVMDVRFGVGIKKFLFEQNNEILYDRIRGKIREQVNAYMSFVSLDNIDIKSLDDKSNASSAGGLHIVLTYRILPLRVNDRMELTLRI